MLYLTLLLNLSELFYRPDSKWIERTSTTSSRYPIASRKLSLHISDHIDKKNHLIWALFLYILAEINYKTHLPSGFKMEESKNVSNVSILSVADEGYQETRRSRWV